MLKTLLKKQFLGMISGFGGKRKKKGNGVAGYIAILCLIAFGFGNMMFIVLKSLAEPLMQLKLDWLYFVYVLILALVMAVIGGIFMAQSQLYDAKDNDLLLSLPIPPKYILFCRIVPLYAQNFFFQAIVFVPSFIAWALVSQVGILQFVFWVLTLVIFPLFSLFISCLLGFLLELITSKLKFKNFLTTFLSIAFLIAYVLLYTRIMDYINALIENSIVIGNNIKESAFIVYKLGASMCGDAMGFALMAVVSISLFAVLYLILSKTYIKIITRKKGSVKVNYKGNQSKASSQFGALLKKEMRKFFGTPAYLLNCSLSSVFLIVGAVLVIINWEMFSTLSTVEGLSDYLPAIVCVGVAVISAMNAVTAPSISLEGKNIWILQSLPIDTFTILKAKLALHYIITAPFATVMSIICAIAIKANAIEFIMILICPSVVTVLFGELGLFFNLKMPNLNWDNETVVIKQSMSVLMVMLSNLVVFLALAGIFFGLSKVMNTQICLLLCLLLLSVFMVLMLVWLKKKGTKIFRNL